MGFSSRFVWFVWDTSDILPSAVLNFGGWWIRIMHTCIVFSWLCSWQSYADGDIHLIVRAFYIVVSTALLPYMVFHAGATCC